MRYDKRYTRVLNIITAADVPTRADGRLAICHFCQRSAAFSGSFTLLLTADLSHLAQRIAARPHRSPEKVRRPNAWYRQERLLRRMEKIRSAASPSGKS